jgi:hypothetical protein
MNGRGRDENKKKKYKKDGKLRGVQIRGAK